jgi:hypothetical protein
MCATAPKKELLVLNFDGSDGKFKKQIQVNLDFF